MKFHLQQQEEVLKKYGGEDIDVDPLDEFVLLDEDDEENPYAEWMTSNVLDEPDGRPNELIANAARETGINVDMVIDQIMDSSSESRHRHHEDPASGDDASDSSDGGVGNNYGKGGGGDDDGDNGGGDDGGHDQVGGHLSSFTGEEQFTHATQDEDHGSRTSLNVFSRRRTRGGSSRARKQTLRQIEDDDISQSFSSMNVSSHGHFSSNEQPTNSSSYGYGCDYVGEYMAQDRETSSLSSAAHNYAEDYYSHMPQVACPYPVPVPIPIPVPVPMRTMAFSYQMYPMFS